MRHETHFVGVGGKELLKSFERIFQENLRRVSDAIEFQVLRDAVHACHQLADFEMQVGGEGVLLGAGGVREHHAEAFAFRRVERLNEVALRVGDGVGDGNALVTKNVKEIELFADFGFAAPIKTVNAEDAVAGRVADGVSVVDAGFENAATDGTREPVRRLQEQSEARG